MAMHWDKYSFKIAGHYLSALINGDTSGMEGTEEADLAQFVAEAQACATRDGFTVGHWTSDAEESDDWGRCDVSGLFAMRVVVDLMVYKQIDDIMGQFVVWQLHDTRFLCLRKLGELGAFVEPIKRLP